MRRISHIVAIALALSALGCTSNDTSGTPSTADCSKQIRVEGAVYTSHGYTERNATKYSTAEAAECHDVGRDAAGSVFSEHPPQVTTWTFAGYPPKKVLGVRFDHDSFAVFVGDTVPVAERERIFRELHKPAA